jgi:hypothetical protein
VRSRGHNLTLRQARAPDFGKNATSFVASCIRSPRRSSESKGLKRRPSASMQRQCLVIQLRSGPPLPYRGGERRFHPFAKFMPYRKSCAHNQARQPSNPFSCAAPYVPPSRFPPLEVCVRRPRCASRHRHGAGIRKPSQKRKHWIGQLYFRLASWAVFTVRNGLDHPI